MENNQKKKVVYINSCSSCGKGLKDEWRFCPFCKASVEVFNCSACGREIMTRWSFCPYCTKEVRDADKDAYKVDRGNEWLKNILQLGMSVEL